MTAEQFDREGHRVSDADRTRVVAQLQQHCADGRLNLQELADRIGEVYAAQTWRELDATQRDLPRTPPSVQAHREVASRTRSRVDLGPWRAYLVVNLFLIAVWALTGAGYFWPVWVLLGWGLPLLLRNRRQLH